MVGGNNILPYQQNLVLESVVTYDQAAQSIVTVPQGAYLNTDGMITVPDAKPGTAFTVSYKASPVYIAWRRSGAISHFRMFGGGTDALPIRMRAQWLDQWLRARNQAGQSASPFA